MSKDSLDFIQLNLRKSFAAAVELNSSIKKVKEYVCLITEPHTYKDRVSTVPPGSNVIAEGKEPRAAILYSRGNLITKLGCLLYTSPSPRD